MTDLIPDPILSPEMYCDEEERQKAIAEMRAAGQLPDIDVRPQRPTRADFAAPNEVIVHVAANARPDDLGRLQFTAFWLTEQEWVPCDRVRGQVFYANLDEHIAFDEKRGLRVRVVRTGVAR